METTLNTVILKLSGEVDTIAEKLVLVWKERLKGGEAKTRPHETLTNANFKVLYINKLYFD